ncbi:hypothetical protein PYCCODRAFT_793525 [Trametes coccinea BRFM310]|uniref:Csf1 N-terminal domain-containing protein n=1 Tax=Trametes coccinea (strain BRFM310) TaxID=1353009 RepID=A0A1Y2J2Q2_TRAC3|nr:hypothetical protein PYCCODRAFT_793525 [Trametes coccinea BRFM310]
MLNVVELVVLALIVIALVLYFFYWNRFFAFLFGLLARFALWNQGESSIWVELGSIQFSVLGGRILIKDLRYHSSNQTFRIVKCKISWRYWLRRPAEEEDLSHARVIGEDMTGKHSSPLACRVHVSLQGLEWFIYNRTAAFDNIVSQLESDIPSTPVPTPVPDGTPPVRKIFSRTSVFRDPSILGPPVSLVSSIYKRTPTFVKRGVSWMQKQLPNLDPKDLLPISLEVVKGAITIGNASTPNLLAAEFQRAEGTYGIVEARSKHDLYKQVFNLKLQNPSVSYVENENYTGPMAEIGKRTHEHVNRSDTAPLRRSSYLSFHTFHRVWQHLRLWTTLPAPAVRHAGPMGMAHPQTWGRRKQQKSVDEETPLGADFATLEYAIERKILEASVMELLYYADVVGVVPPPAAGQETQDESLDPFDIGNGDLPPEWGIDVVVRGGSIRYGPWADRQRVILQHAFFPPTYLNAQPTPRLKPGDMRMWTGMKVFIELRDGVALQIPFREPSKNWQWDGKVEVKDRPRKREAASIHVRAGDSSTISYIVPMVASVKGYLSVLEVHLDTVTVTSSLNDIRLLTAETCRIRSHLPAPLKWNGLRQWTFAISLRQPCLYLLRDHINMFTDLGKDWSTGPPSDYNLFTPMIYVVDLDMHNYDINLYVNDQNIIDKPLIKEDNALLTLRGTHLTNGIHMPFNKYRPEATTVSFWIDAPDVNVSLSLPRWNITSLYATPDRSQVGRIGMLSLKGSYRYFAEVKPEHVDQLKLDFSGRDVVYKGFGWTARYFMILRDNYFGSFTHFSTLNEYLDKRRSGQPLGDPIHLQYREGSSNAMQVTLGLDVDNGLIVLPAGHPGYEKYNDDQPRASSEDLGPCLMLSLPQLQLQLRTNDYYMEMSLNIDTISGRISQHCYNSTILAPPVNNGNRRDKIVIDGLDIVAHRLFGPRPTATTYVCIWEIHVGDVKASVNAYETRMLSSVGSAFGSNFSDPLNAPAKEYALPVDPDVTFLKVQVDRINVVWLVGDAAAELTLPSGLRLDRNDLAGKSFSQVTSLRLPEGTVKLLLSSKQDRSRWIEAADARVDVDLDVYSAPPGWREAAKRQTDFVAAEDAPTGRARILYMQEEDSAEASLLRPGRGALDNDFYLPQIRVPRLSPIDPMRDRLAAPLPSLREDLSESDIDPLPEAVRDARLADLRPSHARPDVLSDEDITSGDESDDDDLTDWSTDYEDFVDDGHTGANWPSVNQYGPHCRHYQSRLITRPSLWSSTPFTLTRDVSRHYRSPGQEASATDALVDSALGPAWRVPMCQDRQDIDRTTYRMRSKRGVIVWLTPLILPVVAQLLEDISTSFLSPELRVDALTMKYIKAFKKKPAAAESITCLDIHLPLVQVRSLQLVQTAAKQGVSQAGDSFITVAELAANGLHFRGCLHSGEDGAAGNIIGCAFSSVSVSLLSRSPTRHSHAQDATAQCHLSIGPSHVSVLHRSLTISLGVLSAEIGHTGPAFVLATIVVLARYSCGLLLAHRDTAGHTASSDRQIVLGILTYSRQRSVVDPLSTIQPSFLVQHGLPDRLRKDITFKFLVYLRYCLRLLDERERQAIQSMHPDADHEVSIEDVLQTLHNQWFGVGGDDDSSDITQQTVLQDLLHMSHPPETPTRSAVWKPPFDVISLTLTGFRLALRHPDDGGQSGFISGPITITLHHEAVELIQPAAGSSGKSYTAPAGRERRSLTRLSLCLTLDHISSTVHPDAVGFAQIALQEYRHYRAPLHAVLSNLQTPRTPVSDRPPLLSRPLSPTRKPSPALSIDCTLSLRSFTFTAATEKLVIRFRNSDVTYASSLLAKFPSKEQPLWDVSTNHSLMFGGAVVEACAVTTSGHSKEYALASLTFADGRTNVVLQQDVNHNMTFRVVVGLGKLHLDVPRSALRLYRFVEGWRADYLPGLETTVRALLAELRGPPQSPRPPSSQASQSAKVVTFQIELLVTSVRATLQVMHGTWLSWEVHRTIGFLMNDNRRRGAHLFGLQMGSHVFGISRGRSNSHPSPSSSIRLELPTITLRGRHDITGVQGLALVESLRVTVRPSDWDTLLSVQQKSGQDFNDLLHIIEQTRQKRAAPGQARSPATAKASKPPLKFHGSFKMKGFRIGLEGLASTVFLECDDVSGGISSHGRSLWHVRLSDLSLSLASRQLASSPAERDRRSAFVRVDFEAHMERRPNAPVPHLKITVAKVHAVMQPSSIGELGDYIDHLQAEVLIRKEQRATELEEFKEKTRSLMRTLDIKIGEQSASQKSLLELYTIAVVINNIGVAFPLSLARDLQMPRSGSHDDSAVRAFLFSIKSLTFGSQLGENGQASVANFAFQFVSRFRQGIPNDFSGDNHKTRNRLLYPEMTADVRSDRVKSSRRTYIGAEVSGFILDVDSTIPDYISSLLDVYRRGKDRVERLGGTIPRSSPSSETSPRVEPVKTDVPYGALPTSHIFASLTFASGKVRMHSKESGSSPHRRGVLSTLIYGRGEDMNGAEEFNLPEVSVWGEFRATPAVHKLVNNGRSAEPSTLIFKSTIHSSQNTLRPTLLPFLTEIMSKVEEHMRSSNVKGPQASPGPKPHNLLPMVAAADELPTRVSAQGEPVSSMKISFSLRIDQSKLLFTCRPDANVIAGLHWDSGGFVIDIAPGARRVGFSGTVGGLTIALKHGFLSEDCVKLDARNLNFTMSFAKIHSEVGRISSSISVVLDTEFAGGVRFSRLQDVLCFKAVWLDRIPVLSGGNATPSDRPSNPPSALPTPLPPSSTKQELTTAILLRFRRVELDVDLGQSISSIKLTLDDALFRTKITEVLTELSLSIEQLSILASGNLSGHAEMPNFQFQTVRRNSSQYAKEAGGRMLDLSMTSGAFTVKLDSEFHELIQYRAEPISVYIYDDWSQISSDVPPEERRVHLDFVVSGTSVLAVMTVGTVPKLVSYVNKFRINLDAQKEGASRESQAFRIANAPKPDNPLSAVANAMFKSARSRLKESDTGISYVIAQRMSLQLERLQLIVFPRSMRDPELAQFVGTNVHARLQRVIEGDTDPAKRELRLHFSAITIAKISQLHHSLAKDRQLDTAQWLKTIVSGSPEATIFALPSMTMYMRSTERPDGARRVLAYDFKSSFEKAGVKDAEDIYISLNMALYSWLTVLRKSFAREMEQVQASADARAAVGTGLGTSGAAQAAHSLRKKHDAAGLSVSPVDDLSSLESFSPVRTRPRARGSISARTVPLAAHSLEDISLVTPPSLKISTASVGTSKAASPPSATSSMDPTSAISNTSGPAVVNSSAPTKKTKSLVYEPHDRKIERLTMRQLGEATPDVMHPFFMKKAGFSLEDSLPQYVHEYATMPTEEIMKALLKLYSKQLTTGVEAPLPGRDA